MSDDGFDLLRKRTNRRLALGCGGGLLALVLVLAVGVGAQYDVFRGAQVVPECDRSARARATAFLFDGRAHPSRSSNGHPWTRGEVRIAATAVRCRVLEGRRVADVAKAFGGVSDDGPAPGARGRQLRSAVLFVPPGRVLGIAARGEPTAVIEMTIDDRTRRVVAARFSCPSGGAVKVSACRGLEDVVATSIGRP